MLVGRTYFRRGMGGCRRVFTLRQPHCPRCGGAGGDRCLRSAGPPPASPRNVELAPGLGPSCYSLLSNTQPRKRKTGLFFFTNNLIC